MSAIGKFYLVISGIQLFLATAFLAVAMSLSSGEMLFLLYVVYLLVSVINFFALYYLILKQKPMQADPIITVYWVLATMILPLFVAFAFASLAVAFGYI